MITFFQYFLFVIFILYTAVTTISFAIYEITQRENKIGGSFVILITLFASLLALFSLWLS